MRRYQKPLWIVWHPHQKLWNSRLAGGLRLIPGVGGRLAAMVIAIDSAILALRVVGRRFIRFGLRKPRLGDRLVYIDCGTHREGLQVRLVSQWFAGRTQLETIAFEASADYHASALRNLADVPQLELRQEALVGPAHEGQTVRLYHDGQEGKGDSLFSERGTAYDDVPAARLSDTLRKYAGVPVLVRMNIEGAESFVIDDLIDAGAAGRVAGWYGMWDDVAKIDPKRDKDFRRTLRTHGIHPVTFNDRDLGYRLREWAIRYDMETMAAARPA